MEQIAESYVGDKEIEDLIIDVAVNKLGDLRKQIFEELYCKGVGGHSGNRATYKRISEYFYWSSIRQDVGRWVRECEVCQQVKGETVKTPGLLRPLPIPQEPWKDISMDFITGLPKSKGFETAAVVITKGVIGEGSAQNEKFCSDTKVKKKAMGLVKAMRQLPQVNEQGIFDLSPLRSLDTRNIVKDYRVVPQVLIQWKGCSSDEAIWEDEDLLKLKFPDFLLPA
ncbi:hypothetical protein AgCh_039579 [Apium graveolens]